MVALVVFAVTATAMGVGSALSPEPINALVRLVVGLLIAVLPAWRSLRRWDELHSS